MIFEIAIVQVSKPKWLFLLDHSNTLEVQYFTEIVVEDEMSEIIAQQENHQIGGTSLCKYSFRDAQDEDMGAVTEIFNEQVRTCSALFTTIEVSVESRINLLHERRAKNFPWIVAVATDESTGEESIAGYATYGEFRVAMGYLFTVEHSLYIHKDHRGRGLGKSMLIQLINIATERGNHVMIAAIGSENVLSIDLHSKHGFVEVGRMPETGFKWGEWKTVVFMQKMLS